MSGGFKRSGEHAGSDRSFAAIREGVGRHFTRANCRRAIGGVAGSGVKTHRIAALIRAEQVDVEHLGGTSRLPGPLLVSI